MNYTIKPPVLNTAIISSHQFKILYLDDSKSNECSFVFLSQ